MAKISIGVPVFNGASLLEDALRALQCQTMSDFEVIISDNASTDATAEIAQRFCKDDSRFRYIRQSENIGARANFLAVVDAATSPYFLWRAYDDLCSLNYLEELAKTAELHPDAELIAPRAITIRIGKARKRVKPVSALERASRPSSIQILRASNAGWFYGLMKTDYARRSITEVIEEYPHLWAWDHLMTFGAILSGRVAFADQAIFFHRLNSYAEKAARPIDREAARTIVKDYRRFCSRRIKAAELSPVASLLMNFTLWRFINARVMPLRRLL